MKTKNFVKIILFMLVSVFLLISLTGCAKTEPQVIAQITVDTSYDAQLASINKILERNEASERLDTILGNIKFDTYSYTLNVFCPKNNDKQIMKASNKRIEQVLLRYGSL